MLQCHRTHCTTNAILQHHSGMINIDSCRDQGLTFLLKSIRVDLAPRIFAITSILSNFKHQQLAYSPTICLYRLQSSAPYQSEDRCMSHKQSIERAINYTRTLFRNQGSSCSTENQVVLVEHYNLPREKLADSRNRKSAGIAEKDSSAVWLHLPEHITTNRYSAK